jgi:glycosyltransferase involved in cell wall biosynthesis
MRINWFSPLPPAKSGIADYTLGILPTFSKKAEVILWTDQTDWEPSLEQYAQIQTYKSGKTDWPTLNRAAVSFYNIGNNHRFHTSIWQVSKQSPGVVVLHDFRLHDFFESLYRGVWRDERGYLAQMEACYGEEGLKAAAEFVTAEQADYDSMAQRFPMFPLVLEDSLATVVHTEEAYTEVKSASRGPVVYTPLPFSGELQGKRSISENGAPYSLIVFGHIGRNRRLESVLEALCLLPERERFHLDIYGEIDDPRSLRNRIHDLKLKQIVTVHGYAPNEELDRALQAASLAINLRYPTMGEASASQLRIWTHALPTLVTKVGWYASLSEETVSHVRPEHEVDDIRSHLLSFLEDPKRFARKGEQGLRFVEREHHPERYVSTLMSLASNTAELNLRKSAYDLAKRSGALLGSWINETQETPLRLAGKIRDLLS